MILEMKINVEFFQRCENVKSKLNFFKENNHEQLISRKLKATSLFITSQHILWNKHLSELRLVAF